MAIYDQSTLGTATNSITFNDLLSDPYYRIKTRQPSRREIREFDIPLPEGTGDADWQSYIGKTYLTIDGVMYPNTEASFHEGREQLRKLASLEVEQADSGSDFGYVPYQWGENVGKQIFVKVMYVDMAESTRLGLKQPFRLICKIKYPTIFSLLPKNILLGVSGIYQLGGVQIPAHVDMSIPSTTSGSSSILPFTLSTILGAQLSSGTNVAVNNGDIATYPSIVIYGPISKPKILNQRTGEYIELDINLPSASDSAVLNYDQDSLSLTAGGSSVYGNLVSGSKLFKLVPGDNQLIFSGASMGTDAHATVNFFDAWPLS